MHAFFRLQKAPFCPPLRAANSIAFSNTEDIYPPPVLPPHFLPPQVATFCVLPASLLFLVLYSRLVAHLPPKAVFYAACSPLLVLYIAFTLVLYPASTWLHPHGFAAALGAHLPIGLHGLLKVIENWTFSLFFCGAELWGSVVISVLFWSLANEVGL